MGESYLRAALPVSIIENALKVCLAESDLTSNQTTIEGIRCFIPTLNRNSLALFALLECAPTRFGLARIAASRHNLRMFRKFLRSKIHRATVTQADLHYEGSLTLPPDLLLAASIAPFEAVHVWNVTRGTRLETYAILGEPGSNDVCINGAAAHLVRPGDTIIIATFGFVQEIGAELKIPDPKVVFVDDKNHITYTGREIPGPRRRGSNDAPSDSCC